MDDLLKIAGGILGSAFVFFLAKGLLWLSLLGRPIYNFCYRRYRRDKVKWNCLCRQPTTVGRVAAKLEAHRYAAFLNVQMAAPPGTQYAAQAGKKIFFGCINAPYFVARKIMPVKMQRWKEKSAIKRRQKRGAASHRRQMERHSLALVLFSAGR
ncbi:MAG: hypothetical protein EYC62_08505 [Alphaproteobacteria bacterium]|nr:MAG: hypothetical protein EYC62_08505 [Alphaproteobacteria bacterium]